MNAIEIYENADRKLNKSEITLGEYERMRDPLRNVIPIPEGATNGDIIKAMFDVSQIVIEGNVIHVYANEWWLHLDYKDWWNSPYKGVEK